MSPYKTKKENHWYRLDNSAILYAAIRRSNFSTVFRFSALMKERVDPRKLQKALDMTLVRFPLFDVFLRKGLFWQYLDGSGVPPNIVRPDTAYPCAPLRQSRSKGDMLRIFYYENRVSVEMFHVLADGDGCIKFFKTLLAVYLRLCGADIPNSHGILDIYEKPHPEEAENAYIRYTDKGAVRQIQEGAAYKYRGTPLKFFTLRVIRGMMPADKAVEVARSYGASVTEYLSAVLIKALLNRQAEERPHRPKPLALAVPVNLRAFFPTKTLRNFIVSLRPSIDPALGDYEFSDIVRQVHHYMRLSGEKNGLKARIRKITKLSYHPLLQLMPLVIKDFAVNLAFRASGDRQFTTTFTNPGIFDLPDEMRPHIAQAEVIIGPAYTARPTCAAMTYGNILTVNFASTIAETLIERDFFTHLVEDGIAVNIESNMR